MVSDEGEISGDADRFESVGRLVNTNPSSLHDPEMRIEFFVTGDRSDQNSEQLTDVLLTGRFGKANHRDSRRTGRRETQGVREIQIESDQSSPLLATDAKHLVVRRGGHFLFENGRNIVTGSLERTPTALSQVFVELEPHGNHGGIDPVTKPAPAESRRIVPSKLRTHRRDTPEYLLSRYRDRVPGFRLRSLLRPGDRRSAIPRSYARGYMASPRISRDRSRFASTIPLDPLTL